MDRAPLILALETATGCGSVAITRGTGSHGRLLAECTCQPEVSHSRRLLGSVEWAMAAAGIGWADLSAVAVSLGPGSFTGLRIGMAAAKGLVMARHGLSLVGVPTLDALAQIPVVDDRLFCCLLDARKQEVYGAFYRQQRGAVERIGDYLALPPERLAHYIHEPVVVSGPGALLYEEILTRMELVRLAPAAYHYPRAANVGFLGCQLYQQGQKLDPMTAAPLYVRASEAEVNQLKAQGGTSGPGSPAATFFSSK